VTDQTEYVTVAGLSVSRDLYDFCANEALVGSGVQPDDFWLGLATLVTEFGPRTAELLDVRQTMQSAIDGWHRDHRGQPHDPETYRGFLEGLGYLLPAGPPFSIETSRVDPEIAKLAAPQLVVPVTNARYALNAANARWGSLYDALYGTDALGDVAPPGPYDPQRGTRVVDWVRGFLDGAIPLAQSSHRSAVAYRLVGSALVVSLNDGTTTTVARQDCFLGFTGEADEPSSILFEHNGLGVDVIIDRSHPVGATDPAGVADVIIEAAATTIVDFEDSVATVNSTEKTAAYRNWLGLMTGRLTEEVTKDGSTFTRSMASDRVYTAPDGSPLIRRSRALLLTRNVGHLMTTPAVLDADGRTIPEGLLDAMVTVLCGLHDLVRPVEERNSPAGSIYVVKPKMHGPGEVSLACEIFSRVEQILGLQADTVKIGIMDEERRTTLNLAECIRVASKRVCFINTGFLDRTGDEIHTAMMAGPMVRKVEMKAQRWISAYEDWNVDIGLATGFAGRAQIGKGMWAAPDLMADLLAEKIGHPRSGASCAWVPSPTAAILHATHYHQVDVASRQQELRRHLDAGQTRATIDDLLTIPLEPEANDADVQRWNAEQIQAELDNNAQSILGYVVRWVDQGIGCSTVPDINDVGLMEDRATCRISSQHMANWLYHGVVTEEQVTETMRSMAAVVDSQNIDDEAYSDMAPGYEGEAFRAACDLVFSGVEQPSGYTEPILHARRLERLAKEQLT